MQLFADHPEVTHVHVHLSRPGPDAHTPLDLTREASQAQDQVAEFHRQRDGDELLCKRTTSKPVTLSSAFRSSSVFFFFLVVVFLA